VPQVSLPRTASNHPAAAAKVELAPTGDSLLNEEVALRDPTPLFLPTQWNAVEDAVREPGGSFKSYAPNLTFPDAQLKLDVAPLAQVPSKTADAFAIDRPDRPYAGFGRTDTAIAPLPIRGGFVVVTKAESGEVVLQQSVLDDRPPAEGTWEPLEFLVGVDPAGIINTPVLTESSRVAAVDAFFQTYAVKQLHLGERLAPGIYRISIGP
jgi:hypothetical protein